MAEPPVEVVASGKGGIAELQQWIDDSAVQWALLQFRVGEGTLARQRLLFLHVNGRDCPALQRGRASELSGQLQRHLRQSLEVESFHASVEVESKEEVTEEKLLQRVLPFFVVDREEYSVKWLQSQYQQQLEAARQGSSAADAKRSTVYEMRHTSFSSGREALKSVAEPMGAWNWAFFEDEDLEVVAGGMGSVEEMKAHYEEHPHSVLFGLVRLGFGEGRLRRTKYVFIHAIGEEVPAVTRGRLSEKRPRMEELLKAQCSVSVSMELLSSSDLSLQGVVERVRKAAVVDDDVLARDKATPSVFSVEGFQRALEEEKNARMEQIRQQRGASLSLREVVSLIRRPDAALNWALFAPDSTWSRRRTRVPEALEAPQAAAVLPQAPAAEAAAAEAAAPAAEAAAAEALEETPKAQVSCRSTVAGSPGVESVESVDSTPRAEPLEPRGVVRLSGPLLKRSGAWHGFWQLRWFQVRSGQLLWWGSPTLVAEEPSGSLDLRGMRVSRQGPFQFTLQSEDQKKKAYVLDADVVSSAMEAQWLGGPWPKADAWIQAMEQESIWHSQMSSENDALASAGKDLLRSLFA